MKNKLRVRVRQLENELEDTLKKIDIVSRAKGFTRGRSGSKPKVQRTQFRQNSRKPFGSNYSSPAYRSNSNKRSVGGGSPSNRSNGSNLRKNSPSAVSNASKKKVQPSNNSNKGSPVGNRLYSPSGRPRENSPNGSQRKPGAVQRANEAYSPKTKQKGPSKAEIYKRYNGLRNSKDKKTKNSKNRSDASQSSRPISGSIYSNSMYKPKGHGRKDSNARSGSARSRNASKNSKATKNSKKANNSKKEEIDIETRIKNLEKQFKQANS